MSAHSHSVTSKFGGFFKSLFGKNTAIDLTDSSTVTAEEVHTPVTIASSKRTPMPAPVQNYSPVSNGTNGNGHGHDSVDRDDFSFSSSLGKKNGNNHSPDNNPGAQTVLISLQAIVIAMPPELRSRVRQAIPDGYTIPVSLEKITAQLSQGAVKIPFGDIRKASHDIFAAPSDADQSLVALPLSEILPHINPGMLNRRPAQKPAAISEEITSPFALGGQGLSISSEKTAATPTPPPLARRPAAPLAPPTLAPAPPISMPAPVQRTQPTPPPVPRQSITSVPTPPAPTAPAPAIAFNAFTRNPAPTAAVPPPTPAPAARPAPITPISPIVPVAPKPAVAQVPPPVVPAAPITPISPIVPAPVPVAAVPQPAPAPAPAPIVAAAPAPIAMPVAAPAPAPANEVPPLVVPISTLAGNWPETIKQEVSRLNLSDAQIALPVALIEAGLKRGRIAFPWKTLQSWIRPAPAPSVSVNDSMELELPLSVIAPLFISRRKSAAAAKAQKVAVDEAIPNLFFGFPQPAAPAAVTAPAAPAAPEPAPVAAVVAPAAKPTETNYFFVEDNASAQPQAEEFKRPVTNATDFTSRKASPDEIIKRAAALEGVVGALIALPDGLKVAASIPAEQNGDALAAFLPQLFNKMSQCTRELRMGDLNNLNFTVGNVPWKIFRVNAVFFAAFGRPGQPLPTAQLVALAGELDRKNKQ